VEAGSDEVAVPGRLSEFIGWSGSNAKKDFTRRCSAAMTQVIDIIVKGGIVMIPLLACSLISLTLTIERLIFWGRIKSPQAVQNMLGLVQSGQFDQALKVGKDSQHPIARVLAAGLAHRNPAPAKAMEAAAQAQIPALKSRLGALDTIITLAPLLGLLGTVVGMIGSFDIMSEAGMGQPHAVTGGVAEALIATATGLLIAILTLIPYNYFTVRVEKEMDAMEHFSSSLELLLHEQTVKH
jgi:biopolymer transport protein ExbB